MFDLNFDRYDISDNQLTLQGPLAQAKITLSSQGVWRFCLGPKNVEKQPWVASVAEWSAFDIQSGEHGLTLQSKDKTSSLSLNLNPFQFTWNNRKFFVRHNENQDKKGFHKRRRLMLFWNESVSSRYYGLGERTGFLNKRGRVWTNWTTDATNHHPHADPLYQAHPFLILTDEKQCGGLFLDESWKTQFDLACNSPSQSSARSDGATLDFYLIPGPDAPSVARGFSQLTGRSPMPPLWALGYHQCKWGYRNESDIRALAKSFRGEGIPCDTLWLDIDYMDAYKSFTFSPERFPKIEELIEELGRQGFKVVTIVDPGIKKEEGYAVYETGKERRLFTRTAWDEELVGEVWPKRAVWPDFFKEDAQAWWTENHKVYTQAGVAGIWNDMNEPAVFSIEGQDPTREFPLDARHGPYDHEEVHNLYGHKMGEATRKALAELRPEKRPFVLTRSGFSGIQKHAWVWTGDNVSSWEHLEMSLPMLLNLSLSGVPFCGADIGGFFQNCQPELLARWIWVGVFYPFMRNHSGRDRIDQEPWSFNDETTAICKAAIEFRYQLLPILYTLAKEACDTGMPILRPCFFLNPEDRESHEIYDQFLFGNTLMVAPALRPGQSRRTVYLPGEWRDLWSGQAADKESNWSLCETPLQSIPLFQKSGSALPWTESKAHTENAYWETLMFTVALGNVITGHVYEDEGEGFAEGSRSEVIGSFDGETLQLDFYDHSGLSRPVDFEILGMTLPTSSSEPCRETERGIVVTWRGKHLKLSWAS